MKTGKSRSDDFLANSGDFHLHPQVEMETEAPEKVETEPEDEVQLRRLDGFCVSNQA